ncbi:hypothetical protein L2E82_19132 [Cichorium intybus]|uniref:Uncharacterized protein n=1 Tax=Cichorium intybus TaxID=13427 RepID=A0ACB9FBC8_CICIN|nr:hypothetical protein L2E82_19132 [Cichorium intybus]
MPSPTIDIPSVSSKDGFDMTYFATMACPDHSSLGEETHGERLDKWSEQPWSVAGRLIAGLADRLLSQLNQSTTDRKLRTSPVDSSIATKLYIVNHFCSNYMCYCNRSFPSTCCMVLLFHIEILKNLSIKLKN